jgi:putative PIN family toxin of toxin-antitoxin system
MQKVVIDTNVLVSALIQKNYPYRIIAELFARGKIQLCISEALMREYCEVLKRQKFARYQDFFARAEILLVYIEVHAVKYFLKTGLHIMADQSDNKILELADECLADYIITGNTTDFTFAEYKQTKIVSPEEYWNKHRETNETLTNS